MPMLAGFLVLAFAANSGAPSPKDIEDRLQPPVQIEGHAAVHYSLAARMAAHHVPAVSVAVIRNGKIAWAQAWGTLEAGGKRAADANTIFQAASISKSVAATAAMHMVQTGALSLDADVNTELKSWKVPAFNFPGKVTLRELLNHSAGMTTSGFPGYAADERVPTLVEVLNGTPPANTEAVRVNVAPGTIWRYSGGGYTVMQQMMIDKSGAAFPDLMARTVLQPIGMTRSEYSQPLAAGLADNAARAHRGNGVMIKGRWHTYPEMAAAGMWTTPSDLSRFLIEIWKSSRGESNRVVNQATVKEMLTILKGEYGLGLEVMGEGAARWFGHGGSNAGFKCDMRMYADSGDGIAVMTNGDDGSALAREIERAAAEAYGWAGLKPQVKKAAAVSIESLRKLAGTYNAGGTLIAVAVSDSGVLTGAVGEGGKVELLPESESVFLPMTDGLPTFKFVRGADGTASAIEFPGGKATRVH
ncbi:MAG TPA: serine hydrolase domain-containing protein [Bryobacteraceae bacterium]|jgi:CubicO group peptidase (beta-lactamase class C family)